MKLTRIFFAALIGANLSAAAQQVESDEAYYVVAKGPSTEVNGTAQGQDGQGRSWWGYNSFGCNLNFSLSGCKPENLYLEFDLYVESPFAKDGLAFPDIEWGYPLDDGKGKQENQNYFILQLQYTESGNWTFCPNGPELNTAYGDIFAAVKNGEWNHISIPFAQSPSLSSLDLEKSFRQISAYFGRMKSDKYIFKGRNFEIVDHGRVTVTEVVPTKYSFVQPSTTENWCQFELGGDPKTNAYITLELDHVDVSKYSNLAFNFTVDITAVNGNEDPELLGNITGAGGQGLILASKPHNSVNWNSEGAGNYAIKQLDWGFGSKTYTVPVSSMNNVDKVDWSDVMACRLYIYDDVLTLAKINLKFTDFYFSGDVVKDVDDTTGIDGVYASDEMEITVVGDVVRVAGVDDALIRVYGASGRKVAEARGGVDLSALPSGIYVATARVGAKHASVKIAR